MDSCCTNKILVHVKNNTICDMHLFSFYTSLIKLMGKTDRCSPALLWGRNCTHPCWACQPPPGSLHTCGSWTAACDAQTGPDKRTCKHGPLMISKPTSCSSSKHLEKKLKDCQSLFDMHLHIWVIMLHIHFYIPIPAPHRTRYTSNRVSQTEI